jgi:hypothetical protein
LRPLIVLSSCCATALRLLLCRLRLLCSAFCICFACRLRVCVASVCAHLLLCCAPVPSALRWFPLLCAYCACVASVACESALVSCCARVSFECTCVWERALASDVPLFCSLLLHVRVRVPLPPHALLFTTFPPPPSRYLRIHSTLCAWERACFLNNQCQFGGGA